MSDADATTTVEVVLRGRRATIQDVQDALDTLRREGIPKTFEVLIEQHEERIPEAGVPWNEQRQVPVMTVSARRAAVLA